VAEVPQEATWQRQPVGANKRQADGGAGAMLGGNASRGGGVDERTGGRGSAKRCNVTTSRLQEGGHQ
jgi:hypothetical protein